MTDLKEVFHRASTVQPPDLWSDVERRTRQPGGRPTDVDLDGSRSSFGQRFAAAAVAFVVFGLGAVLLWQAFYGQERDAGIGTPAVPPPTETRTAGGVTITHPEGWFLTELDPEPLRFADVGAEGEVTIAPVLQLTNFEPGTWLCPLPSGRVPEGGVVLYVQTTTEPLDSGPPGAWPVTPSDEPLTAAWGGGCALGAHAASWVWGDSIYEAFLMGSGAGYEQLIEAFSSMRSTSPDEGSDPASSVYTADLGWELSYPLAWSIRTPGGEFELSNGEQDESQEVALHVVPRRVSIMGHADRDSSFPLDVGDVEGVEDGRRVLEFQGNAVTYTATLTIGDEANASDVERLYDAVESIRFPELELGDEAAGWFALGDHHPEGIGSAVFLSDRDLGYLVRAPHGDYALGPNIDSCGEGQNQTWDRALRQILIECPIGPDVRYELDGTPLPTNPLGYRDPLEAYRVIVAWNGTFLVKMNPPLDVDPSIYW